jgi:hypothetical protein
VLLFLQKSDIFYAGLCWRVSQSLGIVGTRGGKWTGSEIELFSLMQANPIPSVTRVYVMPVFLVPANQDTVHMCNSGLQWVTVG